MLKEISRENLKKTTRDNENDRYKGQKWNRFLNTLKYYQIKIKEDNKGCITLLNSNNEVVINNEEKGKLEKLVKEKYISELDKTKDDTIINYKVHEISHEYWDNNFLKVQEKKLILQYNSGSLFNKEWMHPSRCKFCKTQETIKHSTFKCSKIDKNMIKGLENLIRSILESKITLMWEDEPNFNTGMNISVRGNVSQPLGEWIILNKKESNLLMCKKEITKFLKVIKSE
jgi:hypothetical protein